MANHLQFTDDTIVFLEAKREQVNYLRYILFYFELMSGLKINFSKSSLFGIALHEDIDRFANMLVCKKAFWPSTSLVLPFSDRCLSKMKWDKIIEKCSSRLASWREKLLS